MVGNASHKMEVTLVLPNFVWGNVHGFSSLFAASVPRFSQLCHSICYIICSSLPLTFIIRAVGRIQFLNLNLMCWSKCLLWKFFVRISKAGRTLSVLLSQPEELMSVLFTALNSDVTLEYARWFEQQLLALCSRNFLHMHFWHVAPSPANINITGNKDYKFVSIFFQ